MKPKFELLFYGTNNSSINQQINNVRMLLSMNTLYFLREEKKKIISKIQITKIGTKFQWQKSELEKIYVNGKNTKLICCC